jgi:hypothetical protein
VTAASTAVAAAACLPDLVLPPGFDRVGETRPAWIDTPTTSSAPAPVQQRRGEGQVRLSRSIRALKDADLIPCKRCGLRGHVAGEPGRCLERDGLGLGQSPWMTGEGQ